MDLDILVKVVDELAALLPGARVDKVVQGSDHDLFLVLHQKRRNYFLFLSPQRDLPRIHLVSRKPSGTVAAGFFLFLKKIYWCIFTLSSVEGLMEITYTFVLNIYCLHYI